MHVLLEQQACWHQGERVPVENFLARQPALAADAEAALDLIGNELLLRRELGDTPTLAEYLERFPQWAAQIKLQFEVEQAIESGRSGHSTQRLDAASLTLQAPSATAAGQPSVPGYEILDVLGRGGMGVVYKARQLSLNRLVALKMIRAGEAADPEERSRFRREAEVIAQLSHAHIVQIYEIGEWNGQPYFALELVAGGNLAQQLNGTPQPAREAAQLLVRLAQAIHEAHQHGIVHRDLKPANVLLASAGRRPAGESAATDTRPALSDCIPKIADFGLVKRLEGATGQTQSGAIMGTPSYMAPEQAAGKSRQVGPAADVYALGAILYEMLTGRPPFHAETPMDTLLQVLSVEPVPPCSLQPKVPRDLETICLKCLEKSPARRYATAEVLAEDLRRFLAGESIQARPVSRGERVVRWCRRNPALAVASGVAAAALVAVVALAVAYAVDQHWAGENLRAANAQLSEEQQKTNAALKDVKEQRDTARQLAASLALDRGLTSCEQGDLAAGMLWLSEGLRLTPGTDKHLRQVIRANLACWGKQVRPLTMVLGHPGAAALIANGRFAKAVLIPTRVGLERAVQLHDATTGLALGPPLVHPLLDPHQLGEAILAKDGRTALTWVFGSEEVRIWDAVSGKLRAVLPHPGGVYRVALSPDGAQVVTANKEVQFWDATTGKPLRSLGSLHVNNFAFSPDGKLLLAGTSRGTQLWDVVIGKSEGPRLEDQEVFVRAVGFSPDGQAIFSADDEIVRLFETKTGRLLATIPHKGSDRAVAFSPDSKTVLTGSNEGIGQFWDATTGKPTGPVWRQRGPITLVAFHPEGRVVLIGGGQGSGGHVRFWDPLTGADLGCPLQHPGEIPPAFSADGRILLTGGQSGLVRLWDITDNPGLPQCLDCEKPNISVVAFSPDGRMLLTGAGDGIQLWDADQQRPLGFSLRRPFAMPYRAAIFSPDGKAVLTSADDETAEFRSTATSQLLVPQFSTFDPTEKFTPLGRTTVDLSPDGKTALVGSKNGVRLWDTTTGKPLGPSLKHQLGDLARLGVQPGTVWTGSDKTIRAWEAATGKAVSPSLEHPSEVMALAVSPDGRRVLTGTLDGTAWLWDAATGITLTPPLQNGSLVTRVAFSRDGQTVVTVTWGKTARLWDAVTGKPLGPPLTHGDAITAAIFSPDGRTLLTASQDGIARLWDTATGKPVGPALVHEGAINSAAFHPGGKVVVTGGRDNKARLWRVPPPMRDEPERLRCWVEVLTGMELRDDGAVHALSPADWRNRQERLQKWGGPPLP
jgi:WD40 repeat protein